MANSYKVCIEKGDDPYNTTVSLLDKLDFWVEKKRVLIKPNLTTAKTSSEGITTDVNVCRAILERLKDCQVIIGDAGAGTKKALERNGYYKLGEEFNAEVKDLNDDEIVMKNVPNSVILKRVPLSKTALESDYIISVAKLKCHVLAQVTLCMKNMFGCVPRRTNRVQIHPLINDAIIDILQILWPSFCVVDGIIGNEREEVGSHPIKMGIIIGGIDPLAVDKVGSQCMGLVPEEIRHIKGAEDMFGKREVQIQGEPVEKVRKVFDRSPGLLTPIRYALESISGKILRKFPRF